MTPHEKWPIKVIASGQMTSSQYRDIHYWVERRLGKPKLCSECGSTEKRRYHWANISGEYKKDLSDWKRLCAGCHLLFDKELRSKNSTYWRIDPVSKLPICKHDHLITPENLYISPRGRKSCRACHKIWHLKSRNKAKGIIS